MLFKSHRGRNKFISQQFMFDWRGETSEVFVVRRAANLLANSLVSSKLVSKPVCSKPVSKHLLAIMCVQSWLKVAFGLIHVCSIEWPGEGPLFEPDSNKRRGAK